MPYVSPRRPLPPGRILATAPSPDPEPEPMPTRLPNDDQMRNAQARIHVEGFLGHLQRPGGIFDAPPGDSLITDPQRSDVRDPAMVRHARLLEVERSKRLPD